MAAAIYTVELAYFLCDRSYIQQLQIALDAIYTVKIVIYSIYNLKVAVLCNKCK